MNMINVVRLPGGRPRKAAERNPSGRLKPVFDAISLVKFQRIMDYGDKCAADVRYLTWLGRMYISKELTKRQATTGARIAEIFGRFDHTQGLPKRAPRSPNYDGAYNWRFGIDDAFAAEQAREDWKLLNKHMPTNPRVRFALERLCVDNLLIDYADKEGVRRALDQIAQHLHIGEERNGKKSDTPLHFNAHLKK